MKVSVLDPISKAVERTKDVLFKPFVMSKWFALGFCAFLAALGDSKGCGSNFTPPTGALPPAPGGGSWGAWLQANLGVIAAVGAGGLVLLLGFTALFTWLGSRGRFMFLDGIVRNRGAVTEPWRSFRELANSLFKFWFLWVFLTMGFVIFLSLICLWIAWTDLTGSTFGSPSKTAMLVAGVGVLPVLVLGWLVALVLKDFVTPIMYLRNARVWQAWNIFLKDLVPGDAGNILLFYLMKLVLGLAIGVISGIVVLVTCCVAGLPYLSSVFLLPLLVFSRCYVLYFIEQFGPGWEFFVHEGWTTRCRYCNYDLRMNISGVCPECGSQVPSEQLAVLEEASPPAEYPDQAPPPTV